jgi:hypothetical protein
MVIAIIISLIVGGAIGFVAGVKNANSSKIEAVKNTVNTFKK